MTHLLGPNQGPSSALPPPHSEVTVLMDPQSVDLTPWCGAVIDLIQNMIRAMRPMLL